MPAKQYKPIFITSARDAAYLSLSLARDGLTTMFPGVHLTRDATAHVRRAAGANLILLDAGQLAVSDGTLEVFTSDSAAVEMSDSPSIPAALVSAFQTNSVFLRFTRFLSWCLASDDAIGYVTLPIGGSPA